MARMPGKNGWPKGSRPWPATARSKGQLTSVEAIAMSELSDDELLDALGVSSEPKRTGGRTPREERIIAGFEDIQGFVEANGRTPLHGEARDIFERLYAVRLDRLRALPEARELLAGLDVHGLLTEAAGAAPPRVETHGDEGRLGRLGARRAGGDIAGLQRLRH